MSADIRLDITNRRRERLRIGGHAQGLTLPEKREAPLVPFDGDSLIICEIKRKSPSKGEIAAGLDPVVQAGIYFDAGVRRVSILTEEEAFGGSLADLVAVKKAFPRLSVLRKDFLVDLEDVKTSWRAGADAFLLIASLLDAATLKAMHDLGLSLGMTPLVELHDEEDAAKIRPFKPALTGINSRNLKDFRIDPLRPLKVRTLIDWPCKVLYESGILKEEDALFASGTGFDGVLVGEGAVKNPALIPGLIRAYTTRKQEAADRYRFWQRLYRRYRFERPLVKVCGLTRRDDARLAADLGADALGFILADSPRRITADGKLLERLHDFRDINLPKIGVVVLKEGQEPNAEHRRLLAEGMLDALQFHGAESPETVTRFSGYKALSVRDALSLEKLTEFTGPAVLIDAFSPDAAGGTGKRIDDTLVTAAAAKRELWLAGGLNPDNISGIITQHKPGLVDVSSGLESAPGIKDPALMKAWFKEIQGL
jgi:indole-3-glycerol phosphate synthase/phosphoribosylanthranilate isomerase